MEKVQHNLNHWYKKVKRDKTRPGLEQKALKVSILLHATIKVLDFYQNTYHKRKFSAADSAKCAAAPRVNQEVQGPNLE